MGLDLGEDLLRPLEPKLAAFLNFGAAQFMFRASSDLEHAAARATGD